MKIQKVKIFGIMSYADMTEISFSTARDKPITVFHGENGAGKTSTLNAILWCLTGRLSAKLMEDIGIDPAKFFNRHLADHEDYVGQFEFDGDTFKARKWKS